MFLLAVVLLVSACGSPQGRESVAEGTVFEQMTAHRIPYVGDASGVGRLLAFLPNFDENFTQNMFSLQTESEPFGIVIYYEPSEEWNGNSMIETDEMAIFSEYLFESIDNLGYIEFAYRLTNSNGNLEKDEYQVLLRIYRQ
jgi:hypothetical protein